MLSQKIEENMIQISATWWSLNSVFISSGACLSENLENIMYIGVILWPLNSISTKFQGMPSENFGKYDSDW